MEAGRNAKTRTRKVRVRQSGAETEAQILDAAIRIFADRGYELTSMRDIAQASKITPAAIYLYFQDKDRLYEAACITCFERSTKVILDRVRPDGNPVDQLYDVVHGMALALISDPDAARLFEREVISATNNHLRQIGGVFHQSFGQTLEIVRRAVGEDNAAANAASLFALTLGLIQFSQLLSILDGPALHFHQQADALATHVMNLILPDWKARVSR